IDVLTASIGPYGPEHPCGCRPSPRVEPIDAVLRPESAYRAVKLLYGNRLRDRLHNGHSAAEPAFCLGLVHDQTSARSDRCNQNAERKSCVEVHIEQPPAQPGWPRIRPKPVEAVHVLITS